MPCPVCQPVILWVPQQEIGTPRLHDLSATLPPSLSPSEISPLCCSAEEPAEEESERDGKGVPEIYEGRGKPIRGIRSRFSGMVGSGGARNLRDSALDDSSLALGYLGHLTRDSNQTYVT